MGIQIVSLFPKCPECHVTEDPSIGLYLHIDESGICETCRETCMFCDQEHHASIEESFCHNCGEKFYYNGKTLFTR